MFDNSGYLGKTEIEILYAKYFIFLLFHYFAKRRKVGFHSAVYEESFLKENGFLLYLLSRAFLQRGVFVYFLLVS